MEPVPGGSATYAAPGLERSPAYASLGSDHKIYSGLGAAGPGQGPSAGGGRRLPQSSSSAYATPGSGAAEPVYSGYVDGAEANRDEKVYSGYVDGEVAATRDRKDSTYVDGSELLDSDQAVTFYGTVSNNNDDRRRSQASHR